MGLITILLLLFYFMTSIVQSVLSFNMWELGSFYVENEGFFPKKFEGEYLKYESCLEPLKSNYFDRRMYGVFTLKKKAERIGAKAQMLRETSNNVFIKSSPEWPIENVCDMGYSMAFFEESFTAKWDKETCSIEKGTYYLRNFTMEEDIRNATSGVFPHGHYKVLVYLLADIEGERKTIAESSFLMWFKDDKNKKYEVKSGKSKKLPKCDKYY